tara:strand:- start:190 stop:795 length:606 start_codon:yes stop_codon:yes gene_type:complete
MSQIRKLAKKNKTFSRFTKDYFNYLNNIFNKIDKKILDQLVGEFEEIRKSGKNLFVIGNGGGASTATTMANDLGFDIFKKTKKNPFTLIPLTNNSSIITAISNDVGYENIFINQLKINFKKRDRLLILSASGNSKNLIKAADWVKKNNGKVIGFIGFDGGKIKKLCDICVHLKSKKGDYGPVEDLQLIINHMLAHWFQEKL